MTYQSSHLWKRILAFEFDDPDTAFPFSKKLAQENEWSAAFAQRAIEAYRRFA